MPWLASPADGFIQLARDSWHVRNKRTWHVERSTCARNGLRRRENKFKAQIARGRVWGLDHVSLKIKCSCERLLTVVEKP